MNSFNLVGKIIKEPELSQTSSGSKICRLKVSVNKNNVDNDNSNDIYEVALFRTLADNDYEIGQSIAINGKMVSNIFNKDGNEYYNVSLIGNNVEIIND